MDLDGIILSEADHDPAVRRHVPKHIGSEQLQDIGEHPLDLPEFVPQHLVSEKGAFDLQVRGKDLDHAVLRPVLLREINDLPLDDYIPSGMGPHIPRTSLCVLDPDALDLFSIGCQGTKPPVSPVIDEEAVARHGHPPGHAEFPRSLAFLSDDFEKFSLRREFFDVAGADIAQINIAFAVEADIDDAFEKFSFRQSGFIEDHFLADFIDGGRQDRRGHIEPR
jgi:hypothetical protein